MIPQLLSPVGSLSNLKAAIAGGADAVYLGMNKFNAREFATNFNKDYLEQAVKLCKSNNVNLYLTMNTLVKNSEIKDYLNQLKYAYKKGVDAVIIQDPSFIKIIKQNFPELKIHISTQAGILNSNHANLFSNIESINLARELDKENIKSIRKNYKNNIEIFVHGALCACISGSCLFSSLLGQRSGNRGKCAQPCRKLYNKAFLLSPKELCLIDKLPDIINLKINTLKIEGRMRTPYYAYITTSVYRKAIDSFYNNNFQITPQMRKDLTSAFSREFTEGGFSKKYIFNLKKASGTSRIKKVFYKVKEKPIKIQKRKTANNPIIIKSKKSSGKQLIVRVYNKKDALIAENYADIICADLDICKSIKNIITKPLYIITPRIMLDQDIEKIKTQILSIKPKGIVAGNLGILKMNLNLPIILDYNSNCFNDLQLSYYQSLKAKPIMSPELSIKELQEFKNKDFIVFIHGKIRLMTLAHNIPEKTIIDEKNFNFYIKKIHNGSEVLNEKELGLFNKIRPLIKSGINQIYIDTDQNLQQILPIYRQILDGKTIDVSKLQKNYILGWSKASVL